MRACGKLAAAAARETCRGGCAGSFQWVGYRNDFSNREIPECGRIINLREAAESYDRCFDALGPFSHNPVRFARPSARRVAKRARYMVTPAARLNKEYR